MSETLITVLVCLAIGLAAGVAFMAWRERSKSTDLRGEAIKAATTAIAAIAKMDDEDDVIAAATARKAANAALTASLKAKVDAL